MEKEKIDIAIKLNNMIDALQRARIKLKKNDRLISVHAELAMIDESYVKFCLELETEFILRLFEKLDQDIDKAEKLLNEL